MRYGENPHQSAAFYRDAAPVAGTLAGWTQLAGQGTQLQQHRRRRRGLGVCEDLRGDTPACVIVKHANPCGVAIGATQVEAYTKAWQTDPTSAFGGILAFNRPLDEATARQIGEHKQFVEVLIAPGHHATRRVPCSRPSRTCGCSRCRSMPRAANA